MSADKARLPLRGLLLAILLLVGAPLPPAWASSLTYHPLANQRVARGTYGQVGLGRCVENGLIVAIKKSALFKDNGKFCNESTRELAISYLLRNANHGNELHAFYSTHDERLLGANAQPQEQQKAALLSGSLHMVMEPFAVTLQDFLFSSQSAPLTIAAFKELARGIYHGIMELHERNILHGDLKPQNIMLTDTQTPITSQKVKIVDYGISIDLSPKYRHNPPRHPLLRYVTSPPKFGVLYTRWHRPPEILLGNVDFDFAADYWAFGMILFQMATKLSDPTEGQGNSDIGTLLNIFFLVGTPQAGDGEHPAVHGSLTDVARYPHYNAEMPRFMPSLAQKLVKKNQLVGTAEEKAEINALIAGLLQPEPEKRLAFVVKLSKFFPWLREPAPAHASAASAEAAAQSLAPEAGNQAQIPSYEGRVDPEKFCQVNEWLLVLLDNSHYPFSAYYAALDLFQQAISDLHLKDEQIFPVAVASLSLMLGYFGPDGFSLVDYERLTGIKNSAQIFRDAHVLLLPSYVKSPHRRVNSLFLTYCDLLKLSPEGEGAEARAIYAHLLLLITGFHGAPPLPHQELSTAIVGLADRIAAGRPLEGLSEAEKFVYALVSTYVKQAKLVPAEDDTTTYSSLRGYICPRKGGTEYLDKLISIMVPDAG